MTLRDIGHSIGEMVDYILDADLTKFFDTEFFYHMVQMVMLFVMIIVAYIIVAYIIIFSLRGMSIIVRWYKRSKTV